MTKLAARLVAGFALLMVAACAQLGVTAPRVDTVENTCTDVANLLGAGIEYRAAGLAIAEVEKRLTAAGADPALTEAVTAQLVNAVLPAIDSKVPRFIALAKDAATKACTNAQTYEVILGQAKMQIDAINPNP